MTSSFVLKCEVIGQDLLHLPKMFFILHVGRHLYVPVREFMHICRSECSGRCSCRSNSKSRYHVSAPRLSRHHIYVMYIAAICGHYYLDPLA